MKPGDLVLFAPNVALPGTVGTIVEVISQVLYNRESPREKLTVYKVLVDGEVLSFTKHDISPIKEKNKSETVK